MKNFTHEKISQHVYRIKDQLGVAMYLVEGQEKCCLLDTGYGLKGLKDYIESLCDLPILVLLSHGHIDHALGAQEFKNVYMSDYDHEVYEAHSQKAYREQFIKTQFSQFNMDMLQSKKTINFKQLHDLDCFDLGGITIKAIHVPGHTQAIMMFLIKEEKMILFGDGCGPGTILLEDFSTDIKTYYQSLLKLKKYENEYDIILRNHGTCESSKDLLDNVIEVCKKVLNHQDEHLLLPAEMMNMFPQKSIYHGYSAMKTVMGKHGMQREDGKEGNISYREDKNRQ